MAQRVAYLHNGYVAALNPPAAAMPFVHALQSATGETAMLTQLEGDDVVCTAVVPGNRPGAIVSVYVGMAAPAHTAAAGRTLLAGLCAADLDAYLARTTAAMGTPYPLRSPDALRAELEQIRLCGYALDRGEAHPEACCVASPIVDRQGAIASSVSLILSCSHMKREESALIAATLAVARAIGGLHLDFVARGDGIDSDDRELDRTILAEIETVLNSVSEVMSRVG